MSSRAESSKSQPDKARMPPVNDHGETRGSRRTEETGAHKAEKPEDDSRRKAPDQTPGKQQNPLIVHQIIWLMTIGMMIYFWSNFDEPAQSTIDYSTFKQEIRSDNVASVLIKDNIIGGQFEVPVDIPGKTRESIKNFKTILPTFGDAELLPLLEQQGVKITVLNAETPTWVVLLSSMAPWLLLLGLLLYSSHVLRGTFAGAKRGGGAFGFAKSRAKQYEAQMIKTRYSDVAGLDSAKQDLMEIVSFLKNPEKYRALGAKMPKGLLMMGPPGCGKTLLARATAGEAGVPFFSVSGSEFIEMFVGVGASRVRDMFENARKNTPALVFIDEIDSVGRSRGTGMGGGNDEREQTLNQILAEMDGFDEEEAVVVLAATNRPDVLDSALTRPGRFDRKVVLELPGKKARLEILVVHTKRVPLSADVELERIANSAMGFSGADLANLVNEAALSAARADRKEVTQADFDIARDKIVLGSEVKDLLGEEERQRVAYHEAGHALTSLLVKASDPLNKISIVPHGRAMGMTELVPVDERHNLTQAYLEDRLCVLLGGRCAEKIHYGEVSSGAQDDLKRATQLARQMISQWGMSDKIGPINLQASEEHPFLGREMATPTSHSEHSHELVDEEIRALLKRCEDETLDKLNRHVDKLSLLATSLLERESLTGEEVRRLLDIQL